MAEIDNHNNSHSDEDLSDEEVSRPMKKHDSDPDAEIDGSEEEDDVYSKKSKGKKRKSNGNDAADSDDDWNTKKAAKKGPAAANGTQKKKSSAFTKSFKLSSDLAVLVGSDVMKRHEVVKQLWAVIKERKLQDPKNKQYAICDDQLMKVIGVRRFRTFGMMKYLKDHFLEEA